MCCCLAFSDLVCGRIAIGDDGPVIKTPSKVIQAIFLGLNRCCVSFVSISEICRGTCLMEHTLRTLLAGFIWSETHDTHICFSC